MKRKNNFMLSNLGGEALLIPLGSQVINMNGIVLLNVTGRYVWELLAEEHSVENLIVALIKQFDVDYQCAKNDIYTFLDEINRLNLIEK
jgi:hypothetical protein